MKWDLLNELEALAGRKGYYVTGGDGIGYTLNKLDAQGSVTDNDVLVNVEFSEVKRFLWDQPNVSYGKIDESAPTVGDSFFR